MGGAQLAGIASATLTAAKGLLSVGTPLIPTLSTDNASKQAVADLASYAQSEDTLNVPIVQGLINAGVVVPPAGASWYQNGQIVANGSFVTAMAPTRRRRRRWPPAGSAYRTR
jgi:hypothetical protein